MWLALCFPDWPLDCRNDITCGPIVVLDTIDQGQRIIAANRPARECGIRPGTALADARIRLAAVQIHERSRSAEKSAMARLAGWAWRYSDQIHWATADDHSACARLIVEIGASLRLFGGQDTLLASVEHDLAKLGYRYRFGLGRSPQAALAFSRSRTRPACLSGPAVLPLACLDLDPQTLITLKASGFKQTGELFALPPATLLRRFGRGLVEYLERLRARRPHGLSLYRLPEHYQTRHELIGAVENTRGLIFVLRRIFAELEIFLRGADSAIQTLRLRLFHERKPATRITLRLSAPSYDARHLEQIAGERLARITLAAPVLEIALASDRLRDAEHPQQTLWHRADTHDDLWPRVLDRLRARLGHDAVGWLESPADHRPEYATAYQGRPPSLDRAGHADIDALPRPLWLIDPPERLTSETLKAIRWLSGPERIESGWWDQGQRRDYYRVLDAQGRLAWLFRDLRANGVEGPAYFLHGLFA